MLYTFLKQTFLLQMSPQQPCFRGYRKVACGPLVARAPSWEARLKLRQAPAFVRNPAARKRDLGMTAYRARGTHVRCSPQLPRSTNGPWSVAGTAPELSLPNRNIPWNICLPTEYSTIPMVRNIPHGVVGGCQHRARNPCPMDHHPYHSE